MCLIDLKSSGEQEERQRRKEREREREKMRRGTGGSIWEFFFWGGGAGSSVYFLSHEANPPLVSDTQIIQPRTGISGLMRCFHSPQLQQWKKIIIII